MRIFAMQPDALRAVIEQDRAAGSEALRDRRQCRHDHDDRGRSAGADRRDREGVRPLAACRCGDGGVGDDPAGMPLDVGRHRGAPICSILNPHKWLGAAFDCSTYYVRDPEHLIRVMSDQSELSAAPVSTAQVGESTATGAFRSAGASAR